MVIWKFAKANGIDHGMSIDKVGDAINTHFFAGQAKPEWITDILSGRKTPFRELSNAAWKAQYNRRQIVQQAQNLAKQQAQNPVVKTLQRLWNAPRAASVFGHGVVFPVTHAGDLALRPGSWGVFMKGLMNTWTKSWSPAATERLLDTMKRQPLFDTALRSGLDIGEGSHTDQILLAGKGKGSPGERAWSILKAMRFELWNHEMEKYIKPGMSQTDTLDVGKNLAEWANHATGSAKGGLGSIKGISNVMFGPKITQSKLNRIFSDPVKTVGTFSNWKNASAGEKAAAWTRLHGATQYFLTGAGMLAVNQGVLWATGQKDADGNPIKINYQNPTKGDWMAFKGGGLEFSIPGMHSELKTLGQILAVTFANSKAVNPMHESQTALIAKTLGQYALNKANPAIGLGKELATGRGFPDRPLPWVHDEPTKSAIKAAKAGHPKPISPGKVPYSGIPGLQGWDEYLLSHGPIPLTGPIKYVYDQTRNRGASAMDATAWIKAMIIFGVGATGVHAGEDTVDAKVTKTPQQILKETAARNRAAATMLRTAH